MGLQITEELITPELAKSYLSNQALNRAVTMTYVKRLADDISNNRWLEEGDPIKFSDAGKLIDGQHRLNAVIEAGKPQKFVVLRGYKKEAMSVLDTGKARSAAHVGQIIGLEINQTHTACVNALTLPFFDTTATVSRVLEIFNLYNAGIVFACQHIPETDIKPVAPLRALIAKAYYYENLKRLEEFLTVFATGQPTDATTDSSAIALRKNWLLMKSEGRQLVGETTRIEWYLKCQTSLSYFIKQIDTRKITKPRAVVDNYPLPQIQKDTEDNIRRFRQFRNRV